jgi:hypothetical protein
LLRPGRAAGVAPGGAFHGGPLLAGPPPALLSSPHLAAWAPFQILEWLDLPQAFSQVKHTGLQLLLLPSVYDVARIAQEMPNRFAIGERSSGRDIVMLLE